MKQYGIKIVILLLALCMLLASFVGCKSDKDGEDTPVSTIYLTIPAEADKECQATATLIENKLKNLGYEVVRKTDAEEAAPADAYEIRFGQLSFEESGTLLSKIGNYGWAIQKEGKKLYLTATESKFLTIAVNQIAKDAFSIRTNPYAQFSDTVKSYDNELMYLFSGGASKVTLAGNFSDGAIYSAAEDLISNLRKLTGVEISKKGSEEITIEFVVGKYGEKLPFYNAYSIKSEGNTITLAAGTSKGLFKAIDDFYGFVKNFVSFADTKNVCFPANVSWTCAIDAELPMLPVLKNATVYEGAFPGSYVLAAEGSKYEDYQDYLALIEAEGYVLREEHVDDYEYIDGDNVNYTPNYNGDADNTRQNFFRTYTNSQYMAYVYFCEGTKTIRVVASPVEQYNSYVELNAQQSISSTDSFFAMLNIGGENTTNSSWTYVHGMCLVVKLNDGRFIVVDGGNWSEKDTTASEVTRLYNWMKSKSDNGKIVIAAWLFTHAHSDHISIAWRFNQTYRNNENVEIQRYMFNFPTYEYAQPIADTTLTTSYYDTWYPRIMTMVKGINPTVVHTGQTYQFANCKIEILFTHEDFYPRKINSFNNSCTVYKFTIEGKTFLIVGDLEEPGQTQAAAQNGTLLDSDYFQVAHHGWNGYLPFHKYTFNGKPTEVLHPRQDGEYSSSKAALRWLFENAEKTYCTKDGITVIPLS